jgi:hypothetical protein
LNAYISVIAIEYLSKVHRYYAARGENQSKVKEYVKADAKFGDGFRFSVTMKIDAVKQGISECVSMRT